VCPVEGFEEAASEITARYTKVSRSAAGAAKKMMRRAFERDFDAVYSESLPLLEANRSSEEVMTASVNFARRRSLRKIDKEPSE
jgi:enoyl-CoA hydratase/carnithine racemase